MFLRAGLAIAAAGLTGACTDRDGGHRWVLPTDPRVAATEAGRGPGRARSIRLTATEGPIDLGGRIVNTWTYDGILPGREIRVRAGDVIEAKLTNRLLADTTIHWHGLALRNDMDGVPDLTQPALASGATFTYRFTAAHPGTYWFHPHTGVHLERGLYAPLIVEDPDEPAAYDHDWTVVLDDWIDGTGNTPDQVFTALKEAAGGMHMGGPAARGPILRGASSTLLGGHAGDVNHPYHLINGRLATAPHTFTARPGQRARIRVINAAADTAYRLALAGHRMRVTHTDGFPVLPVDADALLIGMGERYDVLVTLADGLFPLTALAEGKNATGRTLIRTGAGRAPSANTLIPELGGKIPSYGGLQSAEPVRLPARPVDVEHILNLTGGMMAYDWTINGRHYDPGKPYPIEQGQRVRIRLRNRTMMWHPVHIHGHTFQLAGDGPRKDTVNILPGQQITCDLDADNPGQWMTHCHNAYHAETGMMTLLGYRT